MIALFDRACGRHRHVLLESLDGRWDDATPAALAHLERCRECERELSITALTLAGLRRLAAEARTVEPPATGWTVVRERVQSAPARWPQMLGLGRAMVSVGLLVAAIVPTWLGPASAQLQTTDVVPMSTPAVQPRRTQGPKPVTVTQAPRENGPRFEKGPWLNPPTPPAQITVHVQPPARGAGRTR